MFFTSRACRRTLGGHGPRPWRPNRGRGGRRSATSHRTGRRRQRGHLLLRSLGEALPASVGFVTRLSPVGASGGRGVIIAATAALPPAFVDGAAARAMCFRAELLHSLGSARGSIPPAGVTDGVAEGSCGSIPTGTGTSDGGCDFGRRWQEEEESASRGWEKRTFTKK